MSNQNSGHTIPGANAPRLKIGGANPTSIGGDQPSVAAFETAFPRVRFVDL